MASEEIKLNDVTRSMYLYSIITNCDYENFYEVLYYL